MGKAHFVDEIGEDNFFEIKEDAINKIYDRLDRDKCTKCQALIFRECQ
jgi:SulP family sulfate permease